MREIPYRKWSLLVHFTRVFAPQPKYFVTINDGELDIITFEVKKNAMDHWKIIQPAPDWIAHLEEQIEEAIIEVGDIPLPTYPDDAVN